MKKIYRITKQHIGKMFKYHSGGIVIYEYICGADDDTYKYLGYWIEKGKAPRIFKCDAAICNPKMGHWEPVSRLELAVMAPKLLEQIRAIEDGTQDTNSM